MSKDFQISNLGAETLTEFHALRNMMGSMNEDVLVNMLLRNFRRRPFLLLPLDVVVSIFEWFSVPLLMAVRQVCSSWRNVVDNNTLLTSISRANGVYVIGARSNQSELTDLDSGACFYNPLSLEWSECPKMEFPRYHCGVCTYDRKVFVAGGRTSNTRSKKVEYLDTVKGKVWNVLPDLHSARSAPAMAVLDHKLYVFGGYDGDSELPSVECLNLQDRDAQWEILAEEYQMPFPTCECASIRLNGNEIVIVGGVQNRGRDNELRIGAVQIFNAKTMTWEVSIPSLKIRRYGFGLATMGNRLLAIGGCGDNEVLDSIEAIELNRYLPERGIGTGPDTPIGGQWTPVGKLKCRRANATSITCNGTVFTVGGYQEQRHARVSVERIDPRTMNGVLAKSLPFPIDGARLAAVE